MSPVGALATGDSVHLPGTLVSAELGVLADERVDVLVVGSGIAGLTVARSLGTGVDVAVVTKRGPGDGSTSLAQGGMAAAIGDGDSPQLHLRDTAVAGAGINDIASVRHLVDEARDAVEFLCAAGASFDREGNGLAMTLEGGHSRHRILHAGGDATGRALETALLQAVASTGVPVLAGQFLVDLLTDGDGTVNGALVWDGERLKVVRAGAVVLASGGVGQLFAETTSPPTCTGDGAAAALRAGADLADLEFVQFHPTVLHLRTDPRPLVSEALRGEGAILRDAAGVAVMEGVHPDRDLAPRDVVARAMLRHMLAQDVDHLFLDATGLPAELLERRFPTVVASCRAAGVEPTASWIPVSPAAHYTIGGVAADGDGRTSLRGLYAAGEVAATGVHGANRLASNSLLEGVVFGRRVATVVQADAAAHRPLASCSAVAASFAARQRGAPEGHRSPADPAHDRAWLRRSMVRNAGVVRDGDHLAELGKGIAARLTNLGEGSGPVEWELGNLLCYAAGLVTAAGWRTESRGAHWRADVPQSMPQWALRVALRRGPDGVPALRPMGTPQDPPSPDGAATGTTAAAPARATGEPLPGDEPRR